MSKYTRSFTDEHGLHIEFGQCIIAANFEQACQIAIDLAKAECSSKNAVAVVFEAQGVSVQVTEADNAEVQFAIWQRKLSNDIERSTMTTEAKSSLADGEVLGRDADGGLIQWDATAGAPYNSGQSVEEFGLGNLSEPELKRLNPQFATGNWMHLFGTGSKETRCRIVIDLQQCKLVAAQEWTGFKFEDIRGARLEDLAESVIEVNEAHANLDDWNAELVSGMPEWAAQAKTTGVIQLPAKLEWAKVAVEQPEIGLSLKGHLVTNPLYDAGKIDKVDPQEHWGLSQEQANFIVGLNDQLSEAVEDAINAACLRLQTFAGITDGGYAEVHFSDPAVRNKLMEVFAAYIVNDVNLHGD